MGKLFGDLTNTQLATPGGPTISSPDPGQVAHAMSQSAQPSMQDPTSGSFSAPPQGPQATLSKPSFLSAMSTGPGGTPNALSPGLTKGGKLLTILTAAAKGGLAGLAAGREGNPRTGYAGYGGGIEAGMNLPFMQAQQREQLQRGQLQNQQTAAQIQYLPQILGANLNKTQAQTSEANAKATQATATAAEIPQKQSLAEAAAEQKKANQNRKQGLDVHGDPIAYEDLSPVEQAHQDLIEAQTEGRKAASDLAKAKNDPNSAAYKMAFARVQTAQRNAATAAGRLGVEQDKFNADYLGTGPSGTPLAGGPTTDSGQPMGVRVANAGAAPGGRLTKGDLAVSVHENTASIRSILQQRPDLVGALQGRFTNFEQMIGNNDKDISALGVAGHNAALAGNGIHGVKGQQAVHETEAKLLNNLKNGPEGIIGGLNEMDKSAQVFIDAAKRGKKPAVDPTTQPKPAQPAPSGIPTFAEWKKAQGH